MLTLILVFIGIVLIWGFLSVIAVQQVYSYAYKTDGLSRTLTYIYIIVGLLLVINGFRMLLGLNIDQLIQ